VVFNTTDAGAAALLDWYRAMKGSGLTGVLIPNTETNDAWWVRHAADYADTVTYADYRDVAMTLVEHATGVPL
jgi:hypothetical protein